MKAYMSDSAAVATVAAQYDGWSRRAKAEELADTALAEARAILAETEPGTEGWGDIPFPTTHAVKYLTQDTLHQWFPANGSKALNGCFVDERIALAESLAAFVEE